MAALSGITAARPGSAGELIPIGDLASGSYNSRAGEASTANLLALSIKATGIQKP